MGIHNRQFRFDQRFRRLLGRTRRELEDDLKSDFPFLPAGSRISLDPVARKIVLDNVRSALPSSWPRRIDELRALGNVTLPAYLRETGLELDDIYRGNRTFKELRRVAVVSATAALDGEEAAEGMLLTLLTPKKGTYASLNDAAAALWRHLEIRGELVTVLELLKDQPCISRHQSTSASPSPCRRAPRSHGRRSWLRSVRRALLHRCRCRLACTGTQRRTPTCWPRPTAPGAPCRSPAPARPPTWSTATNGRCRSRGGSTVRSPVTPSPAIARRSPDHVAFTFHQAVPSGSSKLSWGVRTLRTTSLRGRASPAPSSP